VYCRLNVTGNVYCKVTYNVYFRLKVTGNVYCKVIMCTAG